MTCDIIIPIWNQLEFTKDCIDSIVKNTKDYSLVLVDNASTDEVKNYLEGLKASYGEKIRLIRNDKNLGFVKAVNQGIASSKAPYICVMNNDTVAYGNWLGEMVNIAESSKDIGIVNPSSNNLGQSPQEGVPISHYAARFDSEKGKFIELGAAIGFCMLIKRAVIEKIGAFDEIYGMGNFEDTDFSRRAVKEGYRCVRACGAYVHHRQNTSFNKIRTFSDDFKRNREIYEFRWGRPKRLAYVLDIYDSNTLLKIGNDALVMARLGNWIWCFAKNRVNFPEHSNIIYKVTGDKGFYASVLFKILTKKKRFDEIFVGSQTFGRILKWLDFIHKARVNYY